MMNMNNMQGNMMNMQQMQGAMIPQQQQMQQASIDQRYVVDCQKILPSIVPENPMYRDNAGTVFYQYVHGMVGPQRAPKVTGMLIDLKIDDIRQMMTDWHLFSTRVKQADEVLAKQQPSQ